MRPYRPKTSAKMRIRICAFLSAASSLPERSKTYHADEETRLLRSSPYTGIANDANSEASSETRKTDRETGTELDEALVQGHPHVDYLQRQ